MVQHMKWWGWGEEQVAFTHEDKPGLAPFVLREIGIDLNKPAAPPTPFEALEVPWPNLPADLMSGLLAIVGTDHSTHDALPRVVHAYGKSLRDLVRIRRGQLGHIPDVVVFPASEEEVAAIVALALAHDAVLIPFGGGSNIAGSLEAPTDETRTVISLDLGRMRSVLDVDEASGLARIQAGALGPDIEEQLAERGWTLGHFPDSFNHSTLGGWIATRSSGMQSDKYGDIADITRAVRVVTPTGILSTRPVPSTSTGPSVREMILGSEGRLGVITEATVQVHRTPEQRTIRAYLFPNWNAAVAAINELAASNLAPSVTRISDANETRFSFATKKAGSRLDAAVSAGLKTYLSKVRRFDLGEMCLVFIGFEGAPSQVQPEAQLTANLVKRHRGISVGTGPGKLYDQKKFDTPYIRDFLLDRGAFADVSETATSWSQLIPLRLGVIERVNKAFEEIGVRGWLMCHLSHSYHSGACLYFTFAFEPAAGRDSLDQYDVIKSAIQQAFVDFGGTISHHHGVGLEHKPWLEQDISFPGVEMLRGLIESVDPGNNFNPGKII